MLQVHSGEKVPSETPSYSQAACSNGDAPLQFSNNWFLHTESVSRTSLLLFVCQCDEFSREVPALRGLPYPFPASVTATQSS